tara:strand:- start:785 stop:1375 length:591 start_codon:yes stop_codon:yes gene_type:complete
MKSLLSTFLIIFFIQSWTNADDIRDFEIDGMTIGDSLLDFYSLEKVEAEVLDATYYPKSKKIIVVGFESKPEQLYERHEFHIKNLDKKYIIYSVKGIIELPISDCISKKKIITSDIENQTKDLKKDNYKGNYGDSFGNSVAHISDFDFNNGDSIRVWCSEWDQSNKNVKNNLYTDSLSVSLSSKVQLDFIENEAYK